MMNKKQLREYRKKITQAIKTKRYLARNPPTTDITLFKVPDYKLTLDQFKSLFAASALELSGFRPRDADYLLISTYREVILKALAECHENINMEGIASVRFLSVTNRKLVEKWLVSKGRSRFE